MTAAIAVRAEAEARAWIAARRSPRTRAAYASDLRAVGRALANDPSADDLAALAFRDHVVAAPLKRRWNATPTPSDTTFRDHVVAAPLKLQRLLEPRSRCLPSATTWSRPR